MEYYPKTLWHGTSAHLLPLIKNYGLGGRNIMADWKVKDFLKWAFPYFQFDDYDYTDPDYGVLSMIQKSLDENRASIAMNFAHGDLYVTGGYERAASYAKYAPEIMDFVRLTAEIASRRKISIIQDELESYSEIKRFLSLPPKPLVMELPKVAIKYLESENGGSVDLFQELDEPIRSDLLKQTSFRLNVVIPLNEIVNTYPVSHQTK